MDTEYVLVDFRWNEAGWLEAFRLRLTGWLPIEEAMAGISKGVLKWSADCRSLELSEKGAVLTDASAASRTNENIEMIADVLRTYGFKKPWLTPLDPMIAL